MLSSRKVLPLDETKQNKDNVDVMVEFELKKKQAPPLSKMPTLTTEEEKLFNKFKQLLAATSVNTDAANYLNLAYAENDEDLEDLDNMAKEIVDNLAIVIFIAESTCHYGNIFFLSNINFRFIFNSIVLCYCRYWVFAVFMHMCYDKRSSFGMHLSIYIY